MSQIEKVKQMLDKTLALNGQSATWTPETRLLGAVPELDSLTVVNVVAAIEKTFNIIVDDNDINADNFQTLGSLCTYIEGCL